VAKCLVYEEIVKSPVMHGLLATWSGFLDPHPTPLRRPRMAEGGLSLSDPQGDKFYHVKHIGTGCRLRRGCDPGYGRSRSRQLHHQRHQALGAAADTPKYLLCYAVTDPTKGYEGISLFLFDYPNPGVSVLRRDHGPRHLSRSELRLPVQMTASFQPTTCLVRKGRASATPHFRHSRQASGKRKKRRGKDRVLLRRSFDLIACRAPRSCSRDRI